MQSHSPTQSIPAHQLQMPSFSETLAQIDSWFSGKNQKLVTGRELFERDGGNCVRVENFVSPQSNGCIRLSCPILAL